MADLNVIVRRAGNMRSRFWKCGAAVVILSEVIAMQNIVLYSQHGMVEVTRVYFKNTLTIDIDAEFSKSLCSALEEYNE